jgi:hypothetical protein
LGLLVVSKVVENELFHEDIAEAGLIVVIEAQQWRHGTTNFLTFQEGATNIPEIIEKITVFHTPEIFLPFDYFIYLTSCTFSKLKKKNNNHFFYRNLS